MTNITELNNENFENFTSDGVVLVDIWAAHCGPCKQLSPIVDEISEMFEGRVSVGKLNTSDYRDLAIELGVRNIPTLIVFKDGERVDTSIGFKTKDEISELLNKNLN